MAGKLQSPYRAPCSGPSENPRKHLGGCGHNHWITSDIDPKFENITRVEDYLRDGAGDPVNPSGIPPYPRHNHQNGSDCGAGFAIPIDCRPGNPCFADVPGNTADKCCPWPDAERGELNPGGVIIDDNAYAVAPGEMVDMRLCRKIGFKSVQARKSWHGRFGYSSPDAGESGIPVVCGLTCNTCADYGYFPSGPDQTKYLTLSAEIDVVLLDGNSAHVERGCVIDRLSGVMTFSCSNSFTGGAGGTGELVALPEALGLLTVAQNADLGSLIPVYCTTADLVGLYPGVVFTGDTVAGIGSWTATNDFGPGTGVVKVGEANLRMGAGANRKHWDATGTLVLDEAISVTPTGFGYSKLTPGGFEDPTFASRVVNSQLGGPYTSDVLLADVYALLGQWDLADDKQHHWRSDSQLAIGPCVYYNEVPFNVAPTLPTDCPATDSNADLYDGRMMGAPLPAGYGPHFNWDFIEWEDCGGGNWYQKKFGKTSLGSAVPLRSTRWTEDVTLNPVGAGAFLRCKPGSGLFAQKWAETILKRPSQNFFRPAAADRYTLDNDRTGCVLVYTGTGEPGDPYVITLTDPIAGIPTGTQCYFKDKAWAVTRNSDSSYDMTTELAELPAGLRPVGEFDPGNLIFGAFRFQSAWAIGGAVRVLSATHDAGLITVTIDAESMEGDARYLRTGDRVDFTNDAETVTESDKTITVLNEHTFTYEDTVAPVGIWVKSHDAPSRFWWDDQVKGDYLTMEWVHNHRDVTQENSLCRRKNEGFCVCLDTVDEQYGCFDTGGGIYDTNLRRYQDTHSVDGISMPRSVVTFNIVPQCKVEASCGPACHAITPNGEAMRNGNRSAFPAAFTLDDKFGATWQAAIEQSVPDPLWTEPPARCDGFTWAEDDGECTSADLDGITYHAHRPYVEARSSLPAGAPAMPSGTVFGYYTLAELQASSLTDGKYIAAPPTITEGTFNVATTEYPQAAWVIYQKQEVCVCADGRFADAYRANGVSCQ